MRIKGKVYTISTKEICNLPNDCLKLLIARKKLNNMDGIVWCLELAPSKKLFWDIKKDLISWEEYKVKYKKELEYNQFTMDKIINFINRGINVALICYCNDFNFCHRSLIGLELEKRGVDVIYK